MTPDIRLRVLHGPNALSRETLIIASLRPGVAAPGGAAEELSPGGAARLPAILASLGLAGPEAAPAHPTGWTDLLAGLCARILAHLGLPTLPVLAPGRAGEIAFVAGDLPVALRCLTMAVKLLQQAQAADGASDAAPDRTWRQFLAEIAGTAPKPHEASILAACDALGLPCHRLPYGREVQIGEGRHRLLLDLTDTSETSLIASKRAWDKVITNRLLADNGLPVARQRQVDSAEAAWRAALAIGPPVAVKPRMGHQGRGVSLDVASAAEMEAAFAAARAVGPQVLVESMLQGRDYRVMVVRGRVTGIIMSQHPQVVGDGRRSVRALVDAFNGDLDRLAGANVRPIELGAVAERLLRAKGGDFDWVPANGEAVILHELAGTRRGGIPVDATERIHPQTAAMLVQAAAIIGLDVAGIDYRSPDIGRPWHAAGGGICEVNSGSGLAVLGIRPQWVREGLVAPLVAGRQLRMCHVAVIGGDGARLALDALARGLARALEGQGWRLGLALSDSLWLDRYRASPVALAPFDACRRAIENPLLDAAVYVVTPELAAAHGFGLARLDLALFAAGAGLAPAAEEMLRGFCAQAAAPVADGVTPADLERLAARLAEAPRDSAARPAVGVTPPRPTSPG